MTETMKINNKDVDIVRRSLPVVNLKFFVENPRVFSVLRNDTSSEPSQDDIFNTLKNMDHVKQLYQDIKRHGELLEEILVRDGDFQVLEGNSRLAAYKLLCAEDPIKWGKIKCKLLPEDISNSDVYALLGQFHIIGKKDWSPYEQAGFLYRRNKLQMVTEDELAAEMGLKVREVKKLIQTYEKMEQYSDNQQSRWSYYEVLTTSRKLKPAVEEDDDLEDKLVQSIKNNEIERAQELRDKVPTMLKNTKIKNKYLAGKINLGKAIENIDSTGSTNNIYKRINDFRVWFDDVETEKVLLNSDAAVRKKVTFELKRLKKRSERLFDKVTKEDKSS